MMYSADAFRITLERMVNRAVSHVLGSLGRETAIAVMKSEVRAILATLSSRDLLQGTSGRMTVDEAMSKVIIDANSEHATVYIGALVTALYPETGSGYTPPTVPVPGVPRSYRSKKVTTKKAPAISTNPFVRKVDLE